MQLNWTLRLIKQAYAKKLGPPADAAPEQARPRRRTAHEANEAEA